MKVIIAGGTGMVGSRLVLNNCLKSDKINEVRSSVRKPTGMAHHKLTEIVIHYFEDYSEHPDLFEDINFYSFRPGYIYPVTPRKEPNLTTPAKIDQADRCPLGSSGLAFR